MISRSRLRNTNKYRSVIWHESCTPNCLFVVRPPGFTQADYLFVVRLIWTRATREQAQQVNDGCGFQCRNLDWTGVQTVCASVGV